MIRKKHFYKLILATTFCMVAGSSCKRSFLDVPPQGQLTEEQALIDPAAAEKMVGGVYNTLYFGSFGNNTVGFLWVMVNDVASDDADKGSFPADFGPAAEIDNFTFNATNFMFNNIWLGHYEAIVRANKAIDVLNRSTFDETARKRLLGEVRFLRGFYYFNLVRMFGGVPKIISVIPPDQANSDAVNTRASKEEIYAVIVDDLQYGVDNLPAKGEAGSVTGRITKGAAQGMLAKVSLYQKNYQKAFDLAKAVIESGKYSLAPDYFSIHREVGANNSESVFEVQTGPHRGVDNCDAVSPLFSNGQGPRSRGAWTNTVDGKKYDGDLGFGLNTPTADLAGAYEAGDTRRAATIIFINPTVSGGPNPGTVLWDGFRIPTQDSVENQRYSYKAYHSPFKETPSCNGYLDKDFKPKNIRIMRYAEVLLIYAEAAANIGQTGEATNKLNMVRARANLPASTGTIANIWKERRVELAMEQDRFFDLVRQGRAGTVLRAHGKAFVDGKHELFPIPQAQRDLSGGRLTQNPNY
jgi:starch-binding outer membrane protein, SusD/RagB family